MMKLGRMLQKLFLVLGMGQIVLQVQKGGQVFFL